MSDLTELPKELLNELVKFKDVLFQKEKGDALKRESTPFSPQEAQSLGDFNAEVNLLGNSSVGRARAQNYFATMGGMYPENVCNIIEEFVYDVFRSSASKSFKRGMAIKDILQNVKPDVNMPSHQMPEPRVYGSEDKD